jgi:hypothetical protein
VLHRVRVLEIPGFERSSGPTYGTEAVLEEEWSLRSTFEAESALIEASAYGAALDSAAAAKLEEGLAASPDILELSALLALPPDTLICPGHGPLTTVGEEKLHNPFFA